MIARYDFHGVGIEVAAVTAAVGTAVDRRLCHFRSSNATDAAAIRFEYVTVPADRPHKPRGESRPVYDPQTGEALYFGSQELLWIELDDSATALCQCLVGETRVWTANDHDLWLPSHPLLTLPLVELLKRRGLFSVHASGVAVDGRAVLIAGPSGCGKTTLALALLGLGFDFLGDDMTFVRHEGSNLQVLAFPDEVDVTEETTELLPGLRSAALHGPEPGWPKYRLRIEEALDVTIAEEAEPGVILFPQLGREKRSALREITADDALLELVPNVLLTGVASAQAHLDALADLVATSNCYRLETGTDLSSARDLVEELVA